MFIIGQFLKGNKHAPLKIYVGNYAHAQNSNVYNFCWISNSTKVIKNFHWTVLERTITWNH